MSSLRKRKKDKGQFVSKEEQRQLLCSSEVTSRCSSLGFNPNHELGTEEIAVDYLASILVEIFLAQESHENSKHKYGE